MTSGMMTSEMMTYFRSFVEAVKRFLDERIPPTGASPATGVPLGFAMMHIEGA